MQDDPGNIFGYLMAGQVAKVSIAGVPNGSRGIAQRFRQVISPFSIVEEDVFCLKVFAVSIDQIGQERDKRTG